MSINTRSAATLFRVGQAAPASRVQTTKQTQLQKVETGIVELTHINFYDSKTGSVVPVPVEEAATRLGERADIVFTEEYFARPSEVDLASLKSSSATSKATDITKIFPIHIYANQKAFEMRVKELAQSESRSIYLRHDPRIGWGGYATKEIKRGEPITFYTGEIYSSERKRTDYNIDLAVVRSQENPVLTDSPFLSFLIAAQGQVKSLAIDSSKYRSLGAMLQAAPFHSGRLQTRPIYEGQIQLANATVVNACVNGYLVKVIVANADIPEGSPICFDYMTGQEGWTIHNYWHERLPCALDLDGKPIMIGKEPVQFYRLTRLQDMIDKADSLIRTGKLEAVLPLLGLAFEEADKGSSSSRLGANSDGFAEETPAVWLNTRLRVLKLYFYYGMDLVQAGREKNYLIEKCLETALRKLPKEEAELKNRAMDLITKLLARYKGASNRVLSNKGLGDLLRDGKFLEEVGKVRNSFDEKRLKSSEEISLAEIEELCANAYLILDSLSPLTDAGVITSEKIQEITQESHYILGSLKLKKVRDFCKPEFFEEAFVHAHACVNRFESPEEPRQEYKDFLEEVKEEAEKIVTVEPAIASSAAEAST